MPASERLSSLESAFLALESRDVPFVHGCILELEHPVATDALRARLSASIAAIDRYRDTIVHGPLGRARWVPDADFHIERHVHEATVDPPGERRDLEDLAARLLATHLSEAHPLWRVFNVRGLADGRGALVAIVHHSLVDGIAGIRLLERVLDRRDDEELAPPPARAAEPSHAATPRRKLLRWRNAAALGRLLRDGLRPASSVKLNPSKVGRERSVASHSVPLARIRDVERALGVSNNDVVLATVAGALHRYLARRRVEPAMLCDVRAMVPVGRHAPSERAAFGNRVALLLVGLHLDVADPVERLQHISSDTKKLKRSDAASGGDLLVALADVTTPSLLGGVLGLALRMRAFNVLVTNVPGPADRLSLLGARLERLVPIVNLWPHQALAIAVASYGAELTFGVHADRHVMPIASAFAGDLADAFEELHRLAGGPRPSPRLVPAPSGSAAHRLR